MRYFFESGNFSEISLAELIAVFESFNLPRDSIKKVSNTILLVESNTITKETLSMIFDRLAGCIRYGEVIEDLDSFLPQYLDRKKIVYGISVLGDSEIQIKDVEKLANELKRSFRSSGISTRFILPKQKELNAAQVINNYVIENGFELCIFESNSGRMYGNTLAIQDINAFIKRDVERPSVDFDMGVLPQKLAHIMCNLTGLKNGILWDPFCGSGTILMEAAVLGFDVLGSDIDLRALESVNNNIQWLSKEGFVKDIKYNVFYLDIHNAERKLLKDLKRTGINAVVCEPFMGPPQKRILSEAKAQDLLNSVRNLYKSLFNAINEVSSKGFKVVLIVPSYKTSKGWLTFNISELVGKKWDVLNRKYGQGDLKWKRINSIISRNIFILEKR